MPEALWSKIWATISNAFINKGLISKKKKKNYKRSAAITLTYAASITVTGYTQRENSKDDTTWMNFLPSQRNTSSVLIRNARPLMAM